MRYKNLWRRAVEAVSVFINGYVSYDRQFGIYIFGRQEGLMYFFKVAESFQNNDVYTPIGQGGNLLANSRARFLKGSFT